ncbi:NHL repeat-containing protein [Dermatophilaceae bacterium Soc4.6]
MSQLLPQPTSPLSRRTLLGSAGAAGASVVAAPLLATSASAVTDPAPRITRSVGLDHVVLGAAYADMYPTDVVADPNYWYVNDNGRYRLIAVNRKTGVIDYEFAKARVPGTDDLATGRGMGIDAAGYLYVTDTINNRITKMTKRFRTVTSFGGRGDGDGQFRGITDVAVGPGLDDTGAPAEVVYATDKTGHQNNTRINKFTTDGRSIGTMGDMIGLHYGQLVVDPDNGNVIVCDAIVQGFVIFDKAGTVLKKVGGRGGGPGQFLGLPRGIDIYKGKIWVTDSDNRRIQVFDTTGTYLFGFGSLGTGQGQFIGPKGISVSNGRVLVCDLYGYGLDEFDLQGRSTRSFFGGVPPINGVNKPKGLDIDSSGKVHVIDWWRQAIVRCDLDGTNPQQVGQTGDRKTPGALTFPTDVRVQPGTGVIYVCNRESNDIEVLNPDGTSHKKAFFGVQDVHHPVGLAFAPNGDLLVSDSPAKRIVRFTLDANGHGTFADADDAAAIGGLRYCSGLDVAPDGTVWVADNLGLCRRTPAGVWTRFEQATGSAMPFKTPWGVRVGPDGLIYATDSGNNRVVVMRANGRLVAETAPSDVFDGRALYGPQGIAIGPDGLVYVADTSNDRVLALRVR